MHEEYGDGVHFIIVYTIEAHPASSDSPYFGEENLDSYSTDSEGKPVYQPQAYQERVELARMAVNNEGMRMTVLVDEMDNPVWCTYGPAPNIAYLIGMDGKIFAKQGWYDPGEMEAAIQSYLREQ